MCICMNKKDKGASEDGSEKQKLKSSENKQDSEMDLKKKEREYLWCANLFDIITSSFTLKIFKLSIISSQSLP